ncbi:hypothetical protein ACLISU_000117 [Campylobacter coli]
MKGLICYHKYKIIPQYKLLHFMKLPKIQSQNILRNADELIENIHYFYDYEQTKGGRQRVIKWTLEGVCKLFDKIKKLK